MGQTRDPYFITVWPTAGSYPPSICVRMTFHTASQTRFPCVLTVVWVRAVISAISGNCIQCVSPNPIWLLPLSFITHWRPYSPQIWPGIDSCTLLLQVLYRSLSIEASSRDGPLFIYPGGHVPCLHACARISPLPLGRTRGGDQACPTTMDVVCARKCQKLGRRREI